MKDIARYDNRVFFFQKWLEPLRQAWEGKHPRKRKRENYKTLPYFYLSIGVLCSKNHIHPEEEGFLITDFRELGRINNLRFNVVKKRLVILATTNPPLVKVKIGRGGEGTKIWLVSPIPRAGESESIRSKNYRFREEKPDNSITLNSPKIKEEKVTTKQILEMDNLLINNNLHKSKEDECIVKVCGKDKYPKNLTFKEAEKVIGELKLFTTGMNKIFKPSCSLHRANSLHRVNI